MTAPPPVLLGSSPAMRRVMEEARMMAPTSYPVLITGDPGTGKTILARHIHGISSRAAGPFIKARIPELNDELATSGLMGHARGSFTGAYTDSAGLVEDAHGGTLFLDELSEASPRVQGVLRGILDGDGITRVGESRVRAVDVRILFATNADLEEMMMDGTFRRDLRDRIGYMKIEMPPLRKRRADIPELSKYAVEQAARQSSVPSPVISESVSDCLQKAPWAGNIRELESVCRYAVMACRPGEIIELQHLPAEFIRTLNSSGEVFNATDLAERMQLALARSAGNKSEAARDLGISRTQFYRLSKLVSE